MADDYHPVPGAEGEADTSADDSALPLDSTAAATAPDTFADVEDNLEAEPVGEETVAMAEPPPETEPAPLSNREERLRQPRAQTFRRRLRTQVSMLPLALYGIALGGFLLAREQGVEGLPDVSAPALGAITVLVLAFTAVFHALVFERRARGLLFAGFWVWTLAGAVTLVVLGIDEQPDAAEWWPLLLVALTAALLLTYLVERTHDARLVLLSLIALVAGGAAYAVTSGQIGDDTLDRVANYWPLLLSGMGIMLLPLAFRRRTG